MSAEASKTTSSADSYIGSLISLTSKSEIRYEGILYRINTEESSIGLRNVRSFGTEGRKKDGPQVAPSDKVYEYILFRGSDIKDLQVKSSPPVQPIASTSSVDNDPAIIQSHYPLPASTSSNVPPAVSAPSADGSSHGPQLGHPGSSFPGALPLYQPGGNLGSWGPSPPPGANGSGLAMPMYWPGFYGPPNGLPHMPQQTLLRPPHGLAVPPSLQQPMQYSGFNPALPTGSSNMAGPKLPEIPPSLVSSSSTSTTLTSTSLPQFNLPSVPSTALASETSFSSTVSKAPNSGLLSTPSFPSISPLAISAPDASTIAPAVSNKVNAMSSSGLPNMGLSQAPSSVISSSISSQTETSKPSLVTPDQLLQSGQPPISSSSSSQAAHKDVEVVQVSSASPSDVKAEVVKEAQPPILPLPPGSRAFPKPNGNQYHPRQNYNYRGHERGRGRGSGSSRPVTQFTEDFDFTAMNEKFKKDEVWGHLGKSNKGHTKDKDGNGGDDSEEEGEEKAPQNDVTPVYNKDDFFDTLSCNTLEHDSQNGRTRFSEQLKIDAETFGDFVRYRGGRGGRGPNRGGRGRGSYYGRGYGYPGRGRGRGMSSRGS
ncbi:protein decapping 5-like [Chenopodium quinoa]|uniref:Protein decapping 5 n=1 Tax=Chenopodium quinoa TaxID=63459 RepID=A0A803L7A3_CHEQI|nr:protein decapping 5-like [Chenopodium quinoa]